MSDRKYGGRPRLSYFMSSLGLLFAMALSSVEAHEINPVIVDVQLQSDAHLRLTLTLNLEAQLTGIPENHTNTEDADNADVYQALRALPAAELEQQAQPWLARLPTLIGLSVEPPTTLVVTDLKIGSADSPREARESTITLISEAPVRAPWSLIWDRQLGSLAYRVSTPNTQDVATGYLQNGAPSEVIDLSDQMPQSAGKTFIAYIPVGFTHIVPLGLDHILFVIGLFLLSARWQPLLWQVSAFTIAHTITLALGMLGILRVSPSIIEPLIALSIVYVALENIVFKRLHWWRPILIFAFGLLHGLGFASVLTDFGLTTQSFIAGLIGFNLGVELGQLSVIAACYLLVGLWFSRRDQYRQWVVIPASAAIAATGAFWFVQRVLG